MKDKPSLMPIVVIALITSLIFTAAAEAQPNLGPGTMDKFVERTAGWWPILQSYAIYIFKITATLEICLFGIRMVLQRPQINEIIGQFVMTMLFLCFIAAVLANYQEWATKISVTGLKPVVTKLGGGAAGYDAAGQPIAMIFAAIEAMIPVLKDASVWDFGMVMIYVLCMGAIIAVFSTICCRYILVVCEFHIVANAGIILIGLGGSTIFKEYAINVMRYILSVAIKLFILQLIINIGFSILSLADIQALQGQSIQNISLYQLLVVVLQGIILLALAMSLPQTCAGIISGSNVDGGNPLRMIGGAVAGKGLTMVGNASKSLMNNVQNVRTASKIATQQGVSGVGNRLRHMGQSIRQAGMAANPNSIQTQLKSQLNTGKALSHIDSLKN